MALAERIRREGFPSLGFHLLLGADFKEMAQNQGRNLQEGRIVLAQIRDPEGNKLCVVCHAPES